MTSSGNEQLLVDLAVISAAACAFTHPAVTRETVVTTVMGVLREPLERVAVEIVLHPEEVTSFGQTQLNEYCQLRIIQLLASSNIAQMDLFSIIETELKAIIQVDTDDARDIGGMLIGALLLALDELPPQIIERVLTFLGAMTGREEGIRYRSEGDTCVGLRHLPSLSRYLDLGLFSEVFAFMKGMRTLQDAVPRANLDGAKARVASIGSRKGGVGKSTIALALALAHIKKDGTGNVCILDLDITGAVWQYMLEPIGPTPFLNSLLNIDQSPNKFDFGQHTAAQILEVVSQRRIPGVERTIGLATFADWPRTNRYLLRAIANNEHSFSKFLGDVVNGLSTQYDFIIIDNAPGFEPHSLLALVLAAQYQHGLPIVVSTALPFDLRGTLLELSDFRLLDLEPPALIINKADSAACEFFSQEQSVLDIVRNTPGYSEITPSAPILESILTSGKHKLSFQPVPFDGDLATAFRLFEDDGTPLSKIKHFVDSEVFARFESQLYSRLFLDKEVT